MWQKIDRGAIDTSCHPAQIAIMRYDGLGISHTHQIGGTLDPAHTDIALSRLSKG